MEHYVGDRVLVFIRFIRCGRIVAAAIDIKSIASEATAIWRFVQRAIACSCGRFGHFCVDWIGVLADSREVIVFSHNYINKYTPSHVHLSSEFVISVEVFSNALIESPLFLDVFLFDCHMNTFLSFKSELLRRRLILDIVESKFQFGFISRDSFLLREKNICNLF